MKKSFIVYDVTDKNELINSVGSLAKLQTPIDINIVIDDASDTWDLAQSFVKGCCGQTPPIKDETEDFTILTKERDNKTFRIIKYNGVLAKDSQFAESFAKSIIGDTFTFVKSGFAVKESFLETLENIFRDPSIGAIYTDYKKGLEYVYLTSLRPNKNYNNDFTNITIKTHLSDNLNAPGLFEIMRNLHSKCVIAHLPEAYFQK
jgi:hypothetical protein